MSTKAASPAKRDEVRAVRSRDELCELLDRTLCEVDADEASGATLRASGLNVRIEITDLGLVLNVAPSEDPGHFLRWAFDDEGFEPKLRIEMDSRTANAYLQGHESLAIGIARRRVRIGGESRVALLYLPALRLICDRYRRVVKAEHPRLAFA
jgi:hypothetical protein